MSCASKKRRKKQKPTWPAKKTLKAYIWQHNYTIWTRHCNKLLDNQSHFFEKEANCRTNFQIIDFSPNNTALHWKTLPNKTKPNQYTKTISQHFHWKFTTKVQLQLQLLFVRILLLVRMLFETTCFGTTWRGYVESIQRCFTFIELLIWRIA